MIPATKTRRVTRTVVSGKLDCLEALRAMVLNQCHAPEHAEVTLTIETSSYGGRETHELGDEVEIDYQCTWETETEA